MAKDSNLECTLVTVGAPGNPVQTNSTEWAFSFLEAEQQWNALESTFLSLVNEMKRNQGNITRT